MSHPLAAMLQAAARGGFPAADGAVEVLPAPPGRSMAVVAFTAHHVIAADVEPEWVRAQLPADDLSAPMGARFLVALGERIGRQAGSLDVVLATAGRGGEPELTEVSGAEHPRVARAHRYRSGVRVFTAAGGAAVVVAGQGLAGRTEVAVEVEPAGRGGGLGAQALREARRLFGEDEVVFARGRRRAMPRRCGRSYVPASSRSAARCCSSQMVDRQLARCPGRLRTEQRKDAGSVS